MQTQLAGESRFTICIRDFRFAGIKYYVSRLTGEAAAEIGRRRNARMPIIFTLHTIPLRIRVSHMKPIDMFGSIIAMHVFEHILNNIIYILEHSKTQ